jgi:hypothetical protein
MSGASGAVVAGGAVGLVIPATSITVVSAKSTDTLALATGSKSRSESKMKKEKIRKRLRKGTVVVKESNSVIVTIRGALNSPESEKVAYAMMADYMAAFKAELGLPDGEVTVEVKGLDLVGVLK